jgi:hypothetical protein
MTSKKIKNWKDLQKKVCILYSQQILQQLFKKKR